MSQTRHRFMYLSRFIAAILVGICMLTATAIGQDSSTGPSTDCAPYVSVPLPSEAEKAPAPKTPPSCASYRSYRGIGRPVNYAEARACAWQERLAQKAGLGYNQVEPSAWVVGGSLILADIYFNGAGVKRNIPLAMRFACESEAGMASLALPDIAKLNGSLPAHGPFEFCNYALTTFTMNFCVGYISEVEDERRSRYYNSLKPSMSPEQLAAFEKLLAAQRAYIETHASEVDQGGTIRVIRTIGSQKILKDLFRSELIHFEYKKWPALSSNQMTGADALLDREYAKTLQSLRKQTKEEIEEGGITADDLSKVEASWQAYRSAWVEFAQLRYPAAVAAIRAQITLDRYRLLKTIR